MRTPAVLCLALLCASSALAASVGRKISSCDPKLGTYGCPWTTTPEENYASFQNVVNRLDCQQGAGRIMPWAPAPKNADPDFVVTAGPNEAASLTSYTPGEVILIRIRSRNRLKLFRGLMVSPERNAAPGTKVGAWKIVPEVPVQFAHPVACDNRTLVHANADTKASELIMKYVAPPAGTGAVRFHMLIKTGNANAGFFHYPGNELVLQEGAAAPAAAKGSQIVWTKSNVGQSCDAACAAFSNPLSGVGEWTCSDSTFNTGTKLVNMRPVFDKADCAYPYLSSCDNKGLGPKGSTEGYCYYHDTAICAAEGRPVLAAACSASSTNPLEGIRWCPCSDTPATCVPASPTCPNPATQCGQVADTTCPNVFHDCGGCTGNQQCVNKVCTCVPQTCAGRNLACGIHDNGCGGQFNCLNEGRSCAAGENCVNGGCIAATCTPARTCAASGACGTLFTTCIETGAAVALECGSCSAPATCNTTSNTCLCLAQCDAPGVKCSVQPDGCGGSVTCPQCPGLHDQCRNGLCECTPHTCAEHGWVCGVHSNACGEQIDCGTCSSGTCTGSYTGPGSALDPAAAGRCSAVACGAPAASCPTGGSACGPLATTCQSSGAPLTLQCGECRFPNSCNLATNNCTCLAQCPDPATMCGMIDDRCGGQVDCGGCGTGFACSNGQCLCQAQSCQAQGRTCGIVGNGCGGTLECGQCSADETCTNGACQSTTALCGAGYVYRGGACNCDEANGFAFDPSTGTCASSTEEEVSAASSSQVSVSLMLALVALFGLNSRRATLLVAAVAVALLVSPVSAHNWVNSNSRSSSASTVKPHPAGGAMPHVQVGRGDSFQIEWMAAHTSSDMSIFITVKAEDEGVFSRMTLSEIQDYLVSGPGGDTAARNKAKENQWRRYHRKGRGGNDNDNDQYSNTVNERNPNFFQECINGASTGTAGPYYQRPEQFTQGWIRDDGVIDEPDAVQQDPGYPFDTNTNTTLHSQIWQCRYKDAEIDGTQRWQTWYSKEPDRRATYYNPNYPKVISIATFFHGAGQFIRPDFAFFEIPSSWCNAQGTGCQTLPVGRYMVNWQWQGYYDTVDVDLVGSSVSVNNRYGIKLPEGQASWMEIEHAQFENPRYVYWLGCRGIVNNIERCFEGCDSQWCSGFNVVPIQPPAGIYSTYNDASDSRVDVWNYMNEGSSDNMCPKANFANAPAGSFMCYAVHERDDIGFNTVGSVTISNDPADPVFHSKAFIRQGGYYFPSITPQAPDARWRFGSGCDDCDRVRQRSVATSGVNSIRYDPYRPKIGTPKTCRNCDLEPSTIPIVTGRRADPTTNGEWTKVGDNRMCDGYPLNNNNNAGSYPNPFRAPPYHYVNPSQNQCPAGTECVKMFNIGWTRTYGRELAPDECAELVARDPECSSTIMYASNTAPGTWPRTEGMCGCYKNLSCCGACRQVNVNSAAVWRKN